MSKIAEVSVRSLRPNPHRNIGQYPFVEGKIETLRRSIREVGLWEGVIARDSGGSYEIAFGHHRIEAARQELGEAASVAVIVRDLSDEDMLKFMGRENLEDYNTDFLTMLNSWEAANKFLVDHGRRKLEAIEIADILGWSCALQDRNTLGMSATAMACNAAFKLLQGGYLSRDQLQGLTTRDARQICQTIVSRHEQLDRMAVQTNRSTREVTEAKKRYAKAGVKVAEDVAEGRIAKQDIRGSVDVAAMKRMPPTSPLFDVAARAVVSTLQRMLSADSTSEKLREIHKAFPQIELDEDVASVRRIAQELGFLAERSVSWKSKLEEIDSRKIVSLRSVS